MQSKDKTTTSTNTLAPAVNHNVTSYLGKVGNAYGNAAPPRVDARTRRAMTQTQGLAQQPVPGLTEAQNYATGLLSNGGMTGTMQQSVDYLTPFASGQYQEDPRLQRQLDINAERASNAAATRFGGGRYGSAAIGNGLGTAVADANNGIMLQSNENARNRQMQAAQGIGALGQSGAGNALTAGSMLPGLNDLRYDGASRMAGVGDFYQNFNQNQIRNYGAALSPFLGAGASQVNTTPGPTAAQSILGGAATGGAMFGPWGAIGGGLLGAFG